MKNFSLGRKRICLEKGINKYLYYSYSEVNHFRQKFPGKRNMVKSVNSWKISLGVHTVLRYLQQQKTIPETL